MDEVEQAEALRSSLAKLARSKTDEGAWRVLYDALWPFVFATAFRRLKDPDAAEDVAQEVFVRLLNSAPFEQLNGVDELRAYLWRAAINVGNTVLERNRRASQKEHAIRDLGPRVSEDETSNPDYRLLYGEALSLAKEHLGAEDLKLLSVLIAGGTLADAAAALSQTYSATGVRLHRLRAKLVKVLNLNQE